MANRSTTAGKRRVLLIGLDSADAELIETFMASGYMPNFASLRQQGVWSRLGTTAEVMHVSAWPSMYTGTTPGRHGLYHAFQIRAGEQAIHRTQPERCGQPPFWRDLDNAGRRCIIMDAFMDYPLPGFNGIQILEYGTWTWFGAPGSAPPDLLRQIKRRFGPYPAPEHSDLVHVPERPERFRDQLISGATLKARIVQTLAREHEWDLLFVTFGEPHAAGHYLWHFSDPTYPCHPSNGPLAGTNVIRDIYGAIDEAVGKILEVVDDNTDVMITSGDGMGPNYSGSHLMPELLHRMDLFYSDTVGGDSERAEAPKKGMLSTIRHAIPLGLRQAVTRCLPRDLRYRLSMKWVNSGIDWSRSKVFCIPNSNEGYLRVNLMGREPAGFVHPGAERDELLASLRERLVQLVNPQTSMQAADRVVLMDDVYNGVRRPDLPDAAINWSLRARTLDQLESPGIGRISQRAGYQTSPFYTGNHRAAAFVLARGPAFASGISLVNGHILDIAPTVLTILGVDLPARFEGTAWNVNR